MSYVMAYVLLRVVDTTHVHLLEDWTPISSSLSLSLCVSLSKYVEQCHLQGPKHAALREDDVVLWAVFQLVVDGICVVLGVGASM